MKIEIPVENEWLSDHTCERLTEADANFARRRLDRHLVRFDDIWWRGSPIGNRDWEYGLLVDDRDHRFTLMAQSRRTVKEDMLDFFDDLLKGANELAEVGHFAMMDREEGILYVLEMDRLQNSAAKFLDVFLQTEQLLTQATKLLVPLFGPRNPCLLPARAILAERQELPSGRYRQACQL